MNFVNVQAVVALCCMLLCSCNNRTGNGGEAGSDRKKIETASNTDSMQTVKYEVSFSKDVYDFFDVELVYTDAIGKNVVKNVTDDIQLTVKQESTIDSTVMRITAKPKNNIPNIDNTRLYKYDVNCSMIVNVGNNKAKNYVSNSSISIKGDKWKNFVAKERVVMSEVAGL